MNRIIYTRPDGGVSIVVGAPKERIESEIGRNISDDEYKNLIMRTIPESSLNIRDIADADIPKNRDFRNAWCDVTASSNIDIDCEKARDIKLEQIRMERVPLLEEQDKLYIIAIEKGNDTSDIVFEKERLRNITDHLKALPVKGKYNDESILNILRSANVDKLTDKTSAEPAA